MISASEVAAWMLSELNQHGCIYQDDVVDYLVRAKADELLRENAEGNQVIGKSVLDAFMKKTQTTVVWVKSDRYWRFRVAEDELGREARG